MTNSTKSLRLKDYIPSFNAASALTGDYVLRLCIMAIVMQEGLRKFPDLAAGAAMYRVPVELWTMAAIAEVAGPVAIIIGGLFRNQVGEYLTRAGGFLIAGVLAAIIYHVYFGPWMGMRFHALMFAVGLFYGLRGNGTPLNLFRFKRGADYRTTETAFRKEAAA